MFGLGLSEILVIGLLALFFYGPTKLPEVARTFAKFLVQSRRFVNELRYNVSEGIEKIGGNDLKELRNLKYKVDNKLGGALAGSDLPQLLNKAADIIEETPEKHLSRKAVASKTKAPGKTNIKNAKTKTAGKLDAKKISAQRKTTSKLTKTTRKLAKPTRRKVLKTH